ncbi:hypothetical protein [Nostoc sp.]|uniref:hypothetical protein n=1 Tax=Nostoc sp. TaxID=1180 RepID=UPI002FF4BBF1
MTCQVVAGSTSLRTSQEIRSGNAGVDFAVNGSSGAIGSELAYELNWYTSGLLNGFFPNEETPGLEESIPFPSAEGGFYTIGKNHAAQLQDAIGQAKDTLKDLRDHPPHFDIPQPKIPKFEKPQIPEFKFPELPEFKIPGFKLPEPQDKDKPNPNPKIEHPTPKPIPSDLRKQLEQLELSPCGSISFGVVYATKTTGEYFVPNEDNTGGHFEQIRVASSLDEIYGMYSAWESTQDVKYFSNAVEFFESGGGTGSRNEVNVGNGAKYVYASEIGNGVYSGGNPYGSGYPFYYAGGGIVEISGDSSKAGISRVLGDLAKSGYTPQIYKLNVSNPSAKDCPIGKSPPPPDDPPPPPKKKMCCPEIDYRKIKAFIDDAISKLDVVAAIPMSWQIRNEGGKPQLVIQCAEENGVDDKGNKKYKSAMYPITIPHWDGTASDKISLPSYIKGNYEGIYTLNDNTKVTINAKNEIECKRILNALKPHIPKQYIKDAYFKGGVIVRDKPIKESRVKPRYGRYFKDGQKNSKPDWRVDFT